LPSAITLFERDAHRNVLLEDLEGGMAVQANQHVIVHDRVGIILDPGGHKVYNRVLAATLALLKGGELRYLFLSHQDPDVVAAANGWLMSTDAVGYCSQLWTRFIPHFGLDSLLESRLRPLGDEGAVLDLNGVPLYVLPAHFLHSPGNLQLYDPTSKILYSGDLGASLGMTYREVPDFDAHVPFMEAFHRRYMAGNRAMRAWAEMARGLEIETIAPQHGAMFRGAAMVRRFIEWCEQLQCGLDLLTSYHVPGR
jgi:flavorubredoxin